MKYGGNRIKSWDIDFDYTNEIQAPFMQAFDYAPRPPVRGQAEHDSFYPLDPLIEWNE